MIRAAPLSLFLLGLGLVRLHAEQVVISEIMYHPRGDQPEYIEVFNNTSTVFDIAEWRLTGAVHYEFPPFLTNDPAGSFLKPWERIVLSGESSAPTRAAYPIPKSVRVFGPWQGKLKNGEERVTLKDKNGVTVCTVKYADRGHWSPAADGAGHSLVLRDANRHVDDWRNWTVSELPGGTPGVSSVPAQETPAPSPELEVGQGVALVNYASVWRYDDSGRDGGASWREPSFDDSQWRQGPGLLGFDGHPVPEPGLRTVLKSNRQTTCYFRTSFAFTGAVGTAKLELDHFVDDGAVFYLNGQELGRTRLAAGPVHFKSSASANVRRVQEEINVFPLNAAWLVPGRNVLAAEVHQDRATSSDLVFGARLRVFTPWRTNVMINELFADRTGSGFVELFNAGTSGVDLNGYFLSDDSQHLRKFEIQRVPPLTSGGLAAINLAEAGLSATNAMTVYLVAPDGQTVVHAVSASFSEDVRSLGRLPNGSRAWFRFPEPSRRQPNTRLASARGLRLNEIHFGKGAVDWVEVFNGTPQTIGTKGLALASRRDLSDKVRLDRSGTGGTPALLSPKGFGSWDVNFPPNEGEVRLYLVDAADTVLDSGVFAAPKVGEALQAFPDGATEWYASGGPTRDRPNQPVRHTNVVINEVMYDPPSVLTQASPFIELFNRGPSTVDVSGWRFSEGVEFVFPERTTIPPQGFLVVAANAARFRQGYGAIPVVSDFKGRLRHSGELLRLVDEAGNLVNEIDFKTGGDWPTLAHGGGSSMELVHPWMDNSLASAWRDSDESGKGAWKNYSYFDRYRELTTLGQPTDYKELHLHLVGHGHLALRHVGLWKDGTNFLDHPTKLSTNGSSASGWLAQGTHADTFLTNGELHIVSAGRGDNRPNRVEIDCVRLRKGDTYELKFEARWIAGNPRLIAQTWDHSIAQSFLVEMPPRLGTPGAKNSVANQLDQPQAPPQLDSLVHYPAVPRSTNAVTITVKVLGAAPPPAVQLCHRLDHVRGNGVWNRAPMFDDGVNGGDAMAGDGLYTMQLTNYQASGQIAQFYVEATDRNGLTVTLPRRGAAWPALLLIDDRTIPHDLRTERFIVSSRDLNAISQGDSAPYGFRYPRHSNRRFNMTFISQEQEIFYGGEIRNSGSPWTRGGDLGKGKWKLPEDRPFRNHTGFFYDNDSSYHNRIARYLLYALGHVTSENEWVRVLVNTSGPYLKEETEPIANEFLDRNFKNGSRGELYRIDDEWWFTDDWNRTSRDADWGYKSSDNPGRYRTEWMKRTREAEDDFTALISFFKTFSANRYSQEQIERWLDPQAVLQMAAVRGYIADWDSFTMSRGKNGYLYRRAEDSRFQLLQWDSDLAFNDANGGFYGDRIRSWLEKPYNKRLFYYYLAQLMALTESPRLSTWLQLEEDASPVYGPNATFYLNFFKQRNEAVRRTLGKSSNVPFAITTHAGKPFTTTNSTITLTGTAPYRTFKVTLEGRPEAKVSWSNDVAWSMADVPLQPGEQVLTVQGLDHKAAVTQQAKITGTRSMK